MTSKEQIDEAIRYLARNPEIEINAVTESVTVSYRAIMGNAMWGKIDFLKSKGWKLYRVAKLERHEK